jgi:hypothetical protein
VHTLQQQHEPLEQQQAVGAVQGELPLVVLMAEGDAYTMQSGDW